MLKAYLKAEANQIKEFEPFMDTLKAMARFSEIELWNKEELPINSLPCVVQGITLYVAFDTAIDIDQAKQILIQKRDNIAKEVHHLENKLKNDAYRNAKPEQWQEDQLSIKTKEETNKKLASFLDLLKL